MCCSGITCAKCCTFFSFTGVIFLFIMGGLLDNQSLYVHGIDDASKGSQSCYVGAALYIASMVISIAYWVYHNKTQAAALEVAQRDNKQQYGSFHN